MKLTTEKKYQLLLEISQKVRDTLDLDEIMNHLLDTVKTVVHYDAAGIFVLNQDLVHTHQEAPRAMIAGIAQRGFNIRPIGQDAMLMHGKGIIGYVIKTNTWVVAPDVRLDQRYVEGRRETLSEIAVPIIRNERAIGVLNLESDQLSAYSESDLEILQFFADAAAISIEKAMLHRQLLDKELLEKQLQTAREVQSRLFPYQAPEIQGYDLGGVCLPTDKIGGDYFDYIPLQNNRLGVAIADVSGHGIASALVMTAFRALLRTQARYRRKPTTIARAINRVLPEITAESHFVTLLYAILDSEQDTFTYVSCGHPPPLLIRPDQTAKILDCRGPALGFYRDIRYEAEIQDLKQGDILALYTDGVVDITNEHGNSFGSSRLEKIIERCRENTSDEITQKIIQSAQEFSNSSNFLDDFTLVIIKRE